MQTDSSFWRPGILWVTSVASPARPPFIRRSARIRSASARGISATERRLPLGQSGWIVDDNGQLKRGCISEGVPVTVCAVATVAWEGSPGVAVFG
jgi:hypothetical protein